MIGIKTDEYSKYLFILLAILMAVVAFLLIRPFITAILAGVIIAYVFFPLYRWLTKKTKKKNLSALLVTLLVILLIVLPIFFVVNALSQEAYVIYLTAKQKLAGGDILGVGCEDGEGTICLLSNMFSDFLESPKIRFQLEEAVKKVTNFIINSISGLLISIPIIILNFFIIMFVVFYLFKDGPSFVKKIKKILPLKKSHQEHVFKRFGDVTYAVIFGHVSVALIQGALGAVGFLIFGIPSPFLWGAIMVLFALLPLIGPPAVWLPIAIFQIINGYSTGSNNLIVKGVLLILYGALIIGTIDNILKPKLISGKAKIHPILVLLGVLGGLKLFGLVGIFIGPLLLALFMVFIKIYEDERSEVKG